MTDADGGSTGYTTLAGMEKLLYLIQSEMSQPPTVVNTAYIAFNKNVGQKEAVVSLQKYGGLESHLRLEEDYDVRPENADMN